jgi:hypothetical protein
MIRSCTVEKEATLISDHKRLVTSTINPGIPI